MSIRAGDEGLPNVEWDRGATKHSFKGTSSFPYFGNQSQIKKEYNSVDFI